MSNYGSLCFDGYVLQQASLKVFLKLCKLVLQKKQRKKVLDDLRSRDLSVQSMALALVMMSSCLRVTEGLPEIYDRKQELSFPSVAVKFKAIYVDMHFACLIRTRS